MKNNLKDAYELTKDPFVTKEKYSLNDVLNEAFFGKNRIKGVVSSNKISMFINEYLIRNYEKPIRKDRRRL